MDTFIIIFSIVLVLFILYLFLISPGKYNNNAKDSTRLYAHRGVYDNQTIYENTIEAFKSAIDHSYGIELDIALTKDKKVIVFHDSTLKRLLKTDKKINEVTYEELTEIEKNHPFNVPLLENVLELINGSVPLIIEYKPIQNAYQLCEEAEKILENYKGFYSIKSFDYKILYWYKKNKPSIMRGLLVSRRYKTFTDQMSTTLLINVLARPNYISCRIDCTKRISIFFYKNFFKGKVAVWTITDEKTLKKSSDKFNYIIFEGFLPDNNG